MNVKISVFVVCIETIMYLLLDNLHDCTLKHKLWKMNFLKQAICIRLYLFFSVGLLKLTV